MRGEGTIPTVTGGAEPIAYVGMLGSLGAFFLLLLIRLHLVGGITEHDEQRLYLLGWSVTPPLALAAAWLLSRAQKRFLADSVTFPVVLVVSNVLFWAVSLFVLKKSLATPSGKEHAERSLNIILATFGATNAGIFFGFLLGRKLRLSPLSRQIARRLADDAYIAVPLIGAFAMAMFSSYDLTRWSTLAALGICGLPALARSGFRGTSAGTRARRVIDAFVVLLVAAIVYDAKYSYDEHHILFYFSPVASMLGGKRPLVDINCQYGVGPIYFLASLFKMHVAPSSYQGMSAIQSVLMIVQFAIVYFLLRLCFRSGWLCLLALLAMLAVRLFGTPYSHAAYPSSGPLRFLGGYVLLLWIALRGRFPKWTRVFYALEAVTVGIASVWSVEALAGVTGTFLAVVLYEMLFDDGRTATKVFTAIKRIGGAVLATAIVHALLTADIRIHTGEWPHWSYYIAYVVFYANWPRWWMPILAWDPWAPIVLVYFVSLTALLGRSLLFGRNGLRPEHKIVWAMTILGITEFTVYVGRSQIYNLTVYVAEIFVAFYWLDRALRASSELRSGFRSSFLYTALAATTLVVLSVMPNFFSTFKTTALGYVAADRRIASPWEVEIDRNVTDAVNLIGKYQPNQHRIALFMDLRLEPLVLIQARKAHLWPLSNPDQDNVEPTAKARILGFSDGLKVSDIIFLGTGLLPLEDEIVAKLKARFHFSDIEVSPAGLHAIRLDPPSP